VKEQCVQTKLNDMSDLHGITKIKMAKEPRTKTKLNCMSDLNT